MLLTFINLWRLVKTIYNVNKTKTSDISIATKSPHNPNKKGRLLSQTAFIQRNALLPYTIAK